HPTLARGPAGPGWGRSSSRRATGRRDRWRRRSACATGRRVERPSRSGDPRRGAPKSGDPTIDFLLELGRALHRFGAPAHRLEAALVGVANRLGVSAQIFSSPTMLMAAIGTPARQQTFMLRVEPGDVDLGKLARVNHI